MNDSNALLKRRSLRVTIFELFLPVLFFGLLLMLKQTMPPEVHDAQRTQPTIDPSRYPLTKFVPTEGLLYYAPHSTTNPYTPVDKVSSTVLIAYNRIQSPNHCDD